MLGYIANRRLANSFSKIKFHFTDIDWKQISPEHVGIYIHVPFCEQLCAFCPFHKVRYQEKLKDLYVKSIEKEIHQRGVQGEVEWVYIGGGTPNLLSPIEIGRILGALRKYVDLANIGMEGNPKQFTPEYLEAVQKLGVEKLSMGVESLKPDTLHHVNRAKAEEAQIREIVDLSKELGLTVNIDLMVGLPKQTSVDFLYDADRVGVVNPQQITTYPFMEIPGVRVAPEMDSRSMFNLIEQAGEILENHGYFRENVWVFSKTKKIYDSARDELVIDYLGFGAAAFSKVGGSQMVNPPLSLYLDMVENGKALAFQTQVDETSEFWRKFAHELYNLQMDPKVIDEMPRSIKFVLSLLRFAGHVRGDQVTEKGRFFVHDLTKTVVESLPFPINNPLAILNYPEYENLLKSAQALLANRTSETEYFATKPVDSELINQ